MKKIQVLIVDDEPLARSGLRKMLENDPTIEVVAEAANGREALDLLEQHKPDLMFLDVQMPGLSGVQILEQIPATLRPVIVFTTAFDEYAVKAFELHAVDYLLKPFNNRRFAAALERAKDSHRSRRTLQLDRQLDELTSYLHRRTRTPDPNAGLPDRIVVKADGDLHFIDYADVVWVEGQGDYLKIHAGRNSVMIRETMAHMETRLPPGRFVRVHKSAIVNVDHVRKLKPIHYGDHALETNDGSSIRVGRGFRDKLATLIKAGE